MGKLGRRDQTQPPRVRNLSFCNTRRWLGPDRYLLRISLYFRCASCPDLTVRRRCRAASCVSILMRFQLADSQWLFRASWHSSMSSIHECDNITSASSTSGSHAITSALWKKCVHGNRLTLSPSWKSSKQMVHTSLPSSRSP